MSTSFVQDLQSFSSSLLVFTVARIVGKSDFVSFGVGPGSGSFQERLKKYY